MKSIHESPEERRERLRQEELKPHQVVRTQ